MSAEADVERDRLTARLAELNAKVAELNGEAEGIKAELRALGPGEYPAPGGMTLKIIPTREFLVAEAIALVPEDKRQECIEITISAAKVKKHLTPIQVEACMREKPGSKAKVALS